MRGNDRNTLYKLDTNLILVKSNVLSVTKICETELEPMFELPFNDTVINIVKVPVANFLESNRPARGEPRD